ncbi:MAG TPA: ABC transporter substrate-binding protein [Gemmatimonadales bacterium]|nr:ABC transporter substrate-binding protein [Gemmatimonadales bacterium]
MLRLTVAAVLLAALSASAAPAQSPPADDRGTITIVVGEEGFPAVPPLVQTRARQDVADLLFLRLALPGPDYRTAGDKGFRPQLAESWHRRDSLTLVFDLHPRARWHDGRPVTAHDVVFSFERARRPGFDPQRATLLRHLASVTAESDHRVAFRFARAYSEQLYDATYHVHVVPRHLLASIPDSALATSDFVKAPVGNGPYRWGRRRPGEFIELRANPTYFRGAPKLERVIFRVAEDPEAQISLLLSGEVDAHEYVAPLGNVARVEAHPDLRIVPVPSFTVGYLLFNRRDPADTTRPHPIFGDRDVRRALTLALDRARMVEAAFGPYGAVPVGPVPMSMWIRDPQADPVPYDTAQARALLAARGWTDRDGDGVLDREGRPFAVSLNFPTTSAVRRQMALQVQEQLRRLGVRVELVPLGGPEWAGRRRSGRFDIDFSSASMDPSPSGLRQSWSCAGIGGSNVAHYCNPAVDSLIERALVAPGSGLAEWRAVVRTIVEDAPAVFMYTPSYPVAVHRRFVDLDIRPDARWLALPAWRVAPGRQLARDRLAAE